MMSMSGISSGFIHSTAYVSRESSIGERTKVWINVQIREKVSIGSDCILSKDVYVDCGVIIGNRCKIQNSVSIYNGVRIDDDVFIGPNVAFTNDRVPRAFNPDWKITPTRVEAGASVGANSTIVCGITIGEYAMVAAGSVVTRDVPPYTLVMGNPARPVGKIDKMGNRVAD
jgi:UDP-2-acetamido-3-amino-2,3-dideoxy-glucuronate N-acetyltransferase